VCFLYRPLSRSLLSAAMASWSDLSKSVTMKPERIRAPDQSTGQFAGTIEQSHNFRGQIRSNKGASAKCFLGGESDP
jgi:hypothetical protein